MPVTKRLRYEVLRRDNHACRYCGATAPDVKLTIDHVIPQALGGPDEPANLVTACEPCNSGKTSMPADSPIVSNVAEDAVRWAQALKSAAELARADFEARSDYRQVFREAWDQWSSGPKGNTKSIPLDDDWQASLDNFREAGLPDWELEDAVRAAMSAKKVTPANTFRYFAGICWTKIRKMQDQARQIIGADPMPAPRLTSEEAAGGIAERWLAAYQARCEEKGLDCSNVTSERAAEIIAALLEQGYSEDRVSAAAEKAGARLDLFLTEYLPGSWGDFTFDAMAAWVSAWAAVDPESQQWRSSAPSPHVWSDFKAELRGAISAGLADEQLLAACKTAGSAHEGILFGLPDWEGRWDDLIY